MMPGILSVLPLLPLWACGGHLDEQYFLRVAGADLRVHVEGEPSAERLVLLLHGGPGGSGEDYNIGDWSERMEAEVTMVYLDQRGQGASQGVYESGAVTVERLALDVEAVVRSLKLRYGESAQVILLGHSWGGMLGAATLLWTDAGEDVAAWVEVGGAHDVFLLNQAAVPMFIQVGEEQIRQGHHVNRWREIISFAETVDVDRITARDSSRINQYAFEAEGLVPSVRQEDGVSGPDLLFDALTSPLSWPASRWAGWHTNDLLAYESEVLSFTEALDSIVQPSLLVWGQYDFVVPVAVGEDAVARIPDARLVTLPHAGHSPMFNQPAAFTTTVLDFVGALPR